MLREAYHDLRGFLEDSCLSAADGDDSAVSAGPGRAVRRRSLPGAGEGRLPVLPQSGRSCIAHPAALSGARCRRRKRSKRSEDRWSRLIDRERPDASLLLNKPTNRTPHAGGERIKPGSPDEAALKAWIQKLTQLSGVELARALKYREEENSGSRTRRAAD